MATRLYSLHLRLIPTNTEIKSLVRLPVMVGRSDPTTNFMPDIDLENQQGAESGVSRRHLLLMPDTDCFVVKDLNSTNGSYLNGKMMKPHKLYPIQSGDELMLGRLRIRVMYAPFQEVQPKAVEPARREMEDAPTIRLDLSSLFNKHDTNPKPMFGEVRQETNPSFLRRR
jgi:pSer/pThr/pTyr-binding forkhead associated (FHA) protein